MKTFLTHSILPNIRNLSSSGGAVKTMLFDILSKKKIDYAIITRINNNKIETVITNNTKDILSQKTNSIYSPTNPLQVLDKLKTDKKYAIVLLPCHAHTLKRLQSYGIAKEIIFTISLLCNHTPDQYHTNLNFMGKDILYRCSGGIPNTVCSFPNKGFMPITCQQCYLDRSGKDADVSAGDPWHYKKHNLGNGKTVIRLNTKRAEEYKKYFTDIVWDEVEDKIDKYKLEPRHKQHTIPINYWKCNESVINYGDYIPELILKEFGYNPVPFNHKVHVSSMYMIGSHPYRQTGNMCVWGAGCDEAKPKLDFLKRSSVFALRGKESARIYNVDVPVCDPAFLLPLLFPIKRKESGDKIFIPHFKQRSLTPPKGSKLIDIFVAKDKWWELFMQIVNASYVYTSSLHVAVTCQAYNVPYEVYGKISYKWKDIEERYNPIDILKAFPLPILNWRMFPVVGK